jgi:hypothetical protein
MAGAEVGLEEAAADHISALMELVRLFLGYSSAEGKVTPDHAEYWDQRGGQHPSEIGSVS